MHILLLMIITGFIGISSEAIASSAAIQVAATKEISQAIKSGDIAKRTKACSKHCIAANCQANSKLMAYCQRTCQLCTLKNDDLAIEPPSKDASLGNFTTTNLGAFSNSQRIVIRKILGSKGTQKDSLCKTGCSAAAYEDDPNFEKFCIANCAAGVATESKSAAEKLLATSETEKPALCKKECVMGRCGDDPNLARICQSVCGAKYAKDCHMMSISADLMGQISPAYRKSAQAIVNAPDEATQNAACKSKCNPVLGNPCAKDANFAKFCVAKCDRKIILNCTKSLSQKDLESTGAHEDDIILKISKEYRTSATAIEKIAAAETEKTTPALMKACGACTKNACTKDKSFQEYCLKKCPAHSTIECGLTPEIQGSTEKLFAYYQAVGTARKKANADQPSKGKTISVNNYAELAATIDKLCTPNGCKGSTKLKKLCGGILKTSTSASSNLDTEGLTVSKGTLGFRKNIPVTIPLECQ